MTETPQRPEILHPRAVRMGLERVIEHQRVALQETATLAQLYDAHLRPEHPLEAPLKPRQLQGFLARETKAAQEHWVQQFLQSTSRG